MHSYHDVIENWLIQYTCDKKQPGKKLLVLTSELLSSKATRGIGGEGGGAHVWFIKGAIRSDLGLMPLAAFMVANLPFVINSVDQPNILFYSPPTQYHSLFRN